MDTERIQDTRVQRDDAVHVLRLPQVKQAEVEAAHEVELAGREAALAAAHERAEGLDANLTAALAKQAVSPQVTGGIKRQGIRVSCISTPKRPSGNRGPSPLP